MSGLFIERRSMTSFWSLSVAVVLLVFLSTSSSGRAATHYQQLKTFGFPSKGQMPSAPLTRGSDGALYGSTEFGGANNAGVIFRMNKDGSGYSVLHSFATNGLDGLSPASPLSEGSDGALYGTTPSGGSNDVGTVFKLNKDGSNYHLLHSFSTNASDGYGPMAGVVDGSGGVLYGETVFGGTEHGGTVFKLNKDGTGYSLLYNFSTNGVDSTYPVGGVITGRDGALYG